MKLIKIVAMIHCLLLTLSMLMVTVLVMKPAGAVSSVNYEVQPVALTFVDQNLSVWGLETPGSPSPVGQTFNVTIHLTGATVENVPLGVAGVEVHFNFSNILAYAVPIGFNDMLGDPAGVLNEPILETITGGLYNSTGGKSDPPYTDAVSYDVAGAGIGEGWNGDDGLVCTIEFQIIKQPNSGIGEPDFYQPLNIVRNDLSDTLANSIPHGNIQGTLRIRVMIHDVAVTDVTPSKTVVGQGCSMNINVTMANQGDYTETFNVTTYYDRCNWSSGLVGCWKFDEGSGIRAYDTSTYKNDGTLTNGPTWTDGKYGNALSFDGADDYVNVPNSASLTPTEITFEGWFYPLPDTGFQALLSKGLDMVWEDYEFVWIPDGVYGAHFVVSTQGNGRAYWYNAFDVSSNEWHFVAMTYKSGQWRIYYDGQMWERTDVTGSLAGTIEPLQIGAETEGNRYMKGIIDEVRIYNRTLSEEEILADMMRPHAEIVSVTLARGSSTTTAPLLNTTGLAYGNYTVSAYACLVSDETNTTNNLFSDGCVVVTIPGDINGDFKVSLADLVILANAYGSKPGDTKWNPNADINGNNIVDLSDLVLMAIHYGQHYP